MSRDRDGKKRGVPKRVGAVAPMVGAPPLVHESATGKVWRVGFNTQDAKGRLEQLVRSHVLRGALADRKALGGKEGEEVYDLARAKLDGGHYITFAPGWREVVDSISGGILYLQSLLQEHHPEATDADALRLLVNEQEQAQAAIVAISPDFFVAMAVQMGVRPEDSAGAAAAIVRGLPSLLTPAQAQATATAP